MREFSINRIFLNIFIKKILKVSLYIDEVSVLILNKVLLQDQTNNHQDRVDLLFHFQYLN